MSWKSALYDYVDYRNQAEIKMQPYVDTVNLHFVLDDEWRIRQEERGLRLAEWRRERNIRAIENETRLKISRVVEEDRVQEVRADIELKRKYQYEIYEISHTEHRIERERVWLKHSDNRWHVNKIEPIDTEHAQYANELFTGTIVNDREFSQGPLLPSAPYLNEALLKPSDSQKVRATYNRLQAKRYADTWWNGSNPNYIRFEVDCSSFVSQCLHAGGIPMHHTGKRGTGWWYQGKQQFRELWSYSWAVAHSLYVYLSTNKTWIRTEMVDSPLQLEIGDVISYDWDGTGKFGHSVIVAAKAANGMPLVNAHTTDSYHRYWDYRDSYAWTERTQYRFIHIIGVM